MEVMDEVSWNSIISGYMQWGQVEKAWELFEEMPIRRNVIYWTAMINGYGKERDFVEMLSLSRQMLVSADDVQPNSVTMVCLLSACSALCNYEVGRFLSVFIHVNKIHLNANLVTALIYM